MQDRYWMFQRKGVFYAQDKLSGKQKSLKTRDAAAARRMFSGLNQATEQPQMNLAMAKVYLSCKSDEMLSRTWDDVMKEMEQAYTGPTLVRWKTQIRSAPFQGLRKLALLHTESSHFLAVLRHPRAGSSTQKWLRILHNRALDLGWILGDRYGAGTSRPCNVVGGDYAFPRFLIYVNGPILTMGCIHSPKNCFNSTETRKRSGAQYATNSDPGFLATFRGATGHWTSASHWK